MILWPSGVGKECLKNRLTLIRTGGKFERMEGMTSGIYVMKGRKGEIGIQNKLFDIYEWWCKIWDKVNTEGPAFIM